MAYNIVGRHEEVAHFEEKLSSVYAEFITVYGRRRVGKTYLISQFFSQQTGVYFEQTGLNDGGLHEQLTVFSKMLSKSFYGGAKMAIPDNWMEALQSLTNAIDDLPKNKRVTIFFDEMPWLATQKSGFIKALEYYWNTQWTNRKKLILIVCGSAASWMIEKVIYAKGGLHNRITAKIPLQPFTLKEAERYLAFLGINLNRQQILQIYMAIGGIPHYLKSIKKGLSAAQNINALCFQKNGLLFNEFDMLFHSLYEDPESYINIIRTIAQKSQGINRSDLIAKAKISNGGYLNMKLRSLEDAGFITTYLPVGHTRRGIHYRVIDEYTLFYLTWIEPTRNKNLGTSVANHYWESLIKKPSWNTWAGYAFESICYKHVDIIKKVIGLDNIPAFCSNWQYQPSKKTIGELGAQIDLVFDRDDGCITLCEIKYSEMPYLLSKDYAQALLKKEAIFNKRTRNKKQIFWALIVANGVVSNEILKNQIDKIVTLDDFF
ncbi:MAG: ATP-binding protein [Alphaproteobacteria bacterium]